LKLNKPSILVQKYILLLLIPICIILLLRLFGFDGLYGQDSYEYLRYTNAVKDFFLTGKHPGSFFWPILYPFFGAILSFLVETSLALQVISAISISICSIYIFKLLRLLYPNAKHQFVYTTIFSLFSPFLLKMSLIAMSDALGLAFVSLTFYFFFKSYYKQTSLIPTFIFIVAAFMSRYASIIITLPVIIYSTYLLFKQKNIKELISAILLCLICSIPFLILQWGMLFEASSNYFLKEWSLNHFFQTQFKTSDGTNSYTLPNIVYVLYVFFHPGFICIGLLLTAISLKHIKQFLNPHNKLLLICSLLYLFFLAGIPFQNPRVLALAFPLILVLFYFSFEILLKQKFITKHALTCSAVFLILQIVFFTMTFKLIFVRSSIDKELATLIKPYQGKKLYSFDVDLAMQGRGLNFDYKNMYMERYTNYKSKDLILFNPERYKLQWKDKNPMINWGYITENYTLKVLETHPKGWKLYQIQ
jgi:hypothetical protein